jgi:hypothetical protein
VESAGNSSDSSGGNERVGRQPGELGRSLLLG